MSHVVNPVRRRLLAALVSLGAMVIPGMRPTAAASLPTLASPTDPLAVRLAGVFSDRESAISVGREYLRAAPQEAHLDLLIAELCSRQPQGRSAFMAVDHATLRGMLNRQQREDFALGRTVNVKGWILSETEARLCGLTVLL